MFEVNWEEVLARLRFGRYICTVRDLFGEPVSYETIIPWSYLARCKCAFQAVEILSFIMDHGKVRAGDIVPSLTQGINSKSELLRSPASTPSHNPWETQQIPLFTTQR